MEQLGRRVGTLAPEDPQSWKVEDEQRQTRYDVSTVDLRAQLVLPLNIHVLRSGFKVSMK